MQLISIAMTTFNGEQYISEQIESILNQTHTNLQIIICDDGSTDSTPRILETYANKDPRITIIFNDTNIGLVKNFEKALSLCAGEYIALADQDDIWENDKITCLLSAIKSSLLIHSDATLIDAHGTIINNSYTRYSKKNLEKNIYSYIIENNVTGCTTLFSRELLTYALPFPENILVHDWWLALCAYKHGTITYLDQPLIRYRQHESNQIGASETSKIHSFEQREKAYKKTTLFSKTLLKVPFFSTEEKIFIAQLIQYYEDFFSKTCRFHSLFFHLRYFQYFNESKPFSYKLIGLCLSFFGANKQRILWKYLT
ncbi:MAG: glycosyltransferase family 2 protein [Sulfuricurvum sp.]|uniref:glycosyltransferase family 2 protein n=1 Tax=Sulfuricurvum sp. TaxID=2025608 RepID=UPI00262693CB|nr:glycosyltransferase family 2 protein [Sulfuricurvum sp.]MDD5159834.1 glycosyltransferase family 2 protein [Sulfuricurvum sp.]